MELWGVTEDDSPELHEHVKYLSQQELRTSSNSHFKTLIAQLSVKHHSQNFVP